MAVIHERTNSFRTFTHQQQSLPDPVPFQTYQAHTSIKARRNGTSTTTATPESSGIGLTYTPGYSTATITANISSISLTPSSIFSSRTPPSSGSQNSNLNETRSNALPIKAIVGISIGVLGLSCLLLFVLFWIRRNRKVRMQRRLIEIGSVRAGAGAGAIVGSNPSLSDIIRKKVNKQYSNSSFSSYSHHVTNSPSASARTSHKTYYDRNLGHASHDRASLYTNHSSNGDAESYNDLIIKMKMSSRTRFAPPIDAEEAEVETSPIMPMLIGTGTRAISTGSGAGVDGRGRKHFNTQNTHYPLDKPWPPLSSSSAYPITSRTPATTLTIPPTPIMESSSKNADMMASMKHSHSRMESLLAALNIPLSPVDSGADEEEPEREQKTIFTYSMASVSNSTGSVVDPEIVSLQPASRAL